MGILDPKSSQTHEYPHLKWLDVLTGEQIQLLRDGDQMVFVR